MKSRSVCLEATEREAWKDMRITDDLKKKIEDAGSGEERDMAIVGAVKDAGGAGSGISEEDLEKAVGGLAHFHGRKSRSRN